MTSWRMVVRGGSANWASMPSSEPITDTSWGTRRPRWRAARTTPSAMTSEPHRMPVTWASSRACAAAAPPSTVYWVCSTTPVTPGCRSTASHERGVAPAGGRVARRPDRQSQPRVPELGEVLDAELDGGAVVLGEARRVHLGLVAVDEDDRDAAAAQPRVALRVGLGDRVDARDEDDPRGALLEQHLDVLVLVQPARGLGAQHRGVAVLGQRGLDGLGEQREHRVGQLGHHEAHQAGGLAAQPGRSLVARARRSR